MWLETKKARNFNAVVWVLGEVNGYGRGLAAEWRNVAEMRRRKLLRVSGQAARRRDPAHRPGSQGRRHAQAGRRWGHGSAVHHPGRQIKFHQETNRSLQPVAPAAEPAPMSKLAAMQAA